MKIKNLLIALMMLSSLLTYSQIQITGEVVDENEQAISFANVILFNELNGKAVKGELTNENGEFLLKVNKDSFIVQISFIGYETWEDSINIREDVHLGRIILQQDSTILNEVIVKGKKPLLERKVDRMIFNVENSIASQGMSGIEALRNTPLIQINPNGGISIIGKDKVSVMINDRLLPLTGLELKQYIQSLRSDDISKIEIITTPPAKYASEGNSGMINIILKKKFNKGFSGSLNGSYIRNTRNGMRTGLNLNYQKGKFNSSIKIRQYITGYSPLGTRDLITENSQIFTKENRIDRTNGQGVNFSIDYKLSERSNLGVIYDYGVSKYKIDAQTISQYGSNNQIDSTLNTTANHSWDTPIHTFNAYYDLEIDTLGKKMNISLNTLDYISNRSIKLRTQNLDSDELTTARNLNDMDYSIYSGQFDFTFPISNNILELGSKFTHFKNYAQVGFFQQLDGIYIRNDNNSSEFNYLENNLAGYISIQRDFNSKWTTKIGIRYEHTTLDGQAKSQVFENIISEYGEFFPTAYISYKPNMNNSLSVSYSKRINRPGFRALNPFRWYSDPYTYTEGNPILNPAFTHNVEASHSFKNKLTTSIYGQYGINNFSTVARLTDGIYSNIYQNSYDDKKIGLTLNYYNNFFGFWNPSFSLNTFYSKTIPIIPEINSIDVWSLYYSTRNSFSLDKDKKYNFLLNFWHSLPRTYGNTYLESMYELSTGFKLSLLDNDLNINLVLNDILKSIRNDGYTDYSGYQENFTQYNDYQRLTISATYAFGNEKIKSRSKNIDFKESNRIN